MANKTKSLSANAPGNFFVDSSCIDCGTCYWIAPDTFERNGDYSSVFHQPENENSTLEALRALYSCPTNSIGVRNRSPHMKDVAKSFPYKISENVYHCGFHSRSSFGATSYFIKSKDGNILIDSPRYLKRLSESFKTMGGISWQLLSHKDDVADTDLYHKDFNSKRYIHLDDANRITKLYEELFTSEDPKNLSDDIIMIPVPGHTKGSVVYLYKNKFLFTGDHLAFSKKLNHLYAFKTACWYDFSKQIQSMERLLEYDFEYVLPGHGSPFHGTVSEVKESLQKCIEWMKE